MKIKDRINNYLNDNEFRVTVFANKIDIINYKSILDFSSTEISVKVNNKNSNNNRRRILVISKMYDDELLIKGKINNMKNYLALYNIAIFNHIIYDKLLDYV